MYHIINSSTLVLILFSGLLVLNSCDNNASVNKEHLASTVEVQSVAQDKILRHVVMFEFNEKATPEIVAEIEQEFAALADKISEIHSFEWGINNSPEGLNNGLTHCFVVSFLSEEDRAKYLPHPDHQKFVALIGPYVESVTVVDYWKQ